MKKIYSLIFSLLMVNASFAQNFSDGVFVLNEDWYGHNNSSLNFWNHDSGYIDYYIMQLSNNYEYSLGCTAQYGQLYGDYIVITSKQDKDPGEAGNMKSGRITILNKNTLKPIGDEVHPSISVSENGKSDADGRSVCFVNNNKFYIGTSNGIYVAKQINGIWNWDSEKPISGTENELITGEEVSNADGTGPLYNNQIGMMLRTQDYVFAIKQDLGVLVIDPETDEIKTIIEGCYSTMAQSKDGNVWVGVNAGESLNYPYGNSGDAWNGSQLMCIDQYSLETRKIELEMGGVPQSWYAWTAGTLTASAIENVLYFVYTDPSAGQANWFRNCNLYRYDIDKNECTEIYNSENDGLYFYGGAIQCNPKDGNIYAALYVGENIATQDWVYMILDKDGKEVAFQQPIQNYWYPAMFIFPDNEPPAVADFEDITIKDSNPVEITLFDKVSDSDSHNAAIIKTISLISDTAIVDAKIIKGNLVLTPKSKGNATITIEFNSNGKIATKEINVTSTIDNVMVEAKLNQPRINVFTISGNIMVTGIDNQSHIEIYNSQGALIRSQHIGNGSAISGLQKGNLYIVKISNQLFKIIL